MKIGIDAHLVAYRRGMGNYVFNLIRWLPTISDNHEFVVYVRQGDVEAVPHIDGLTLRPLPAAPVPLWEHVLLPLAAARDRLDILHAPANTGPLYLPRSIALVVTIHDVMYLLPYETIPKSPSRYQQLGRLYRRLVVPKVSQRAARILTVSENSKQDIITRLNMSSAKIHVIPEAVSENYQPIRNVAQLSMIIRRYSLKLPFILGLGAIDPRKNTKRLIRAYATFKVRSTTPHYLVLAGLSSEMAVELAEFARSLGIGEFVTFTDFVPEMDLVALYSTADLFVYPSLYEGFGMPVLEAMACGTPVVASRIASVSEIAGDAALLVNPLDIHEMAEAIRSVLMDEPLRNALIDKGSKRIKAFSWKRTAEETLAIYQHVCDLR